VVNLGRGERQVMAACHRRTSAAEMPCATLLTKTRETFESHRRACVEEFLNHSTCLLSGVDESAVVSGIH